MKRTFFVSVFILSILGGAAQTSDSYLDRLEAFKEFCMIFRENYAFSKEKNVNWDTIFNDNKGRITDNTTDEELFKMMAELVKPLNDAHVKLYAPEMEAIFSASRSSRIKEELSSIPKTQLKARFKQMTETTLEEQGFEPIQEMGPKFRGERLFSYTKNGRIGYLRFFRSFSTLFKMNGLSLTHQLNKIFWHFRKVDTLIIDIRFNIGGDDAFSEKVVRYLIDNTILGYSKQTKAKGVFGELKKTYVTPKGNAGTPKSIVLLTNDRTVSAADVFTMMLRDISKVTIIGEPSNGSFSDIYTEKLPNGWKIGLSNQRYFSSEGINYEGVGVPVDIKVENKLTDIENNSDRVLLKALQHIKK